MGSKLKRDLMFWKCVKDLAEILGDGDFGIARSRTLGELYLYSVSDSGYITVTTATTMAPLGIGAERFKKYFEVLQEPADISRIQRTPDKVA